MRLFIFVALFTCMAQFAFISSADALDRVVNKSTSLFLPNIYHSGIKKHDLDDMNIEEPPEPFFEKIKFLEKQPADSLAQRVDRLVHGITIDIPPEYDHYGYEIRRYMSDLLTPSDLNDPEKLMEKIVNVKKAKIILDYWKKAINEEKKAIEAKIKNENVPSSVITSFRFNVGNADKFLADAHMWIDSNQEFLEFLQENQNQYYVQYPFYEIESDTVRSKFKRLYESRQRGLEAIIEYSPFRAMIY